MPCPLTNAKLPTDLLAGPRNIAAVGAPRRRRVALRAYRRRAALLRHAAREEARRGLPAALATALPRAKRLRRPSATPACSAHSRSTGWSCGTEALARMGLGVCANAMSSSGLAAAHLALRNELTTERDQHRRAGQPAQQLQSCAS